MRLKQIKLAGFKSFVDPTTIGFPEGRCAVVGPNGCGKSNIVDAVRWVMGESSAKQLRGESLADVVFNGSSARKPAGMAAVELVFDNSSGRIGGEYAAYAEIAIRRQVSRDSQSTYFQNGVKCRRRDIADLFLGTGFGPRTYSIIEQGAIGELAEARPDDLRAYLEEAAGISKYKERRRETENRIKHTRENLARLQDVREELGRQLERLQKQAKAAERYRALKQEEGLCTAQLHAIRYRRISGQLEALQGELRRQELELERRQTERRALATEIEKARVQHGEANEQSNAQQQRIFQLGADASRIEDGIRSNQQRAQELQTELDDARLRGEEASQQLAMDEARIQEFERDAANLMPQAEAAQQEDQQAAETQRQREQAWSQWQEAWLEFSKRAADHERIAEVQASSIDHLQQLTQRLRARLDRLEEEQQAPSDAESGQVDALATEIEAQQRRREAVESDLERCLKDLAAAREDRVRREAALEDARNDLQELRHQLASLQGLQQAALGRSDERVQAWLEAEGLDGASRLGEVLNVAPGWERAVEAVLGEFLQGLWVEDAGRHADALAAFAGGPVTLLEARLDAAIDGDLPSLASKIRSSDLQLGALLHGLFAASSEAVALARRPSLKPGQSIVTQGGLWVGADWLRKLPVADQDAGIIQRTQALETQNARVEEAERALAELRGSLREAQDRVARLEQDREALQGRAAQLEKALGELKADHGVRRVKLQEADARRSRARQERQDIEQQIAQENQHLQAARAELAAVEAARAPEAQQRQSLAEAKEQLLAELGEARQAARASHDRYHALNAERQALQSRLEASRSARQRLIEQAEDMERRRQRLAQGIEESQANLPGMQRERNEKLAEQAEEEERQRAVRERLEGLAAKIGELEAAQDQANQQVDEAREGLQAAQLRREGLSVEAANLRSQMEAAGQAPEAILQELPEDAQEEDWVQQLERIDRRIQRLGAINLAAIDEYGDQSERKTYLDAQHEDLEEALNTLLAAIRKIDRETRGRFKETFDAVNAHLGKLFPKVFGGGHAYLELTGEDLLDTGVSLMARPPGKRNSSIHLLSGGEKALTAVALIFAIFQLNPSPLCLLDEVDAPLDDANVARFVELIREMSAGVQFIVVTHNKLTMEMADRLIGVTMNEPGVSRLVSVDLDEAAAMAAM